MSDDIYNDILWRLRIPLPYELRGLTVQDIANERKDAADEIERLRVEVDRLGLLASLWQSEFNAAVDALAGKAVRGD